MYKKIYFSVIAFAIVSVGLFAGCQSKKEIDVDKALVRGHITGLSAEEGIIIACYDGEYNNRQFYNLDIDSVGNFVVDIDMPVNATELTLLKMSGDNLHLYVMKDSCLNVDIDWTEVMPIVEYDGNLADVNRVLFAMDSVQISANNNEQFRFDYVGYANSLKTGYENSVANRWTEISNPQLRDYISRLLQLKQDERMYNIYLGIAHQANEDPNNNEDYKRIVTGWDPNDPIMIDAGLIISYIESRCKEEYIHNKVSPIDFERLEIIENELTNPDARRVALSFYGNMFFENKKPSLEDVERFYPKFMSLANECAPQVAEKAKADYEKFMANRPGNRVSYDPTIESVDGTTIKLSELFGTPMYIDLWATWCGPCCAEIPHLEKLVERFKGSKDIKFVSISVDEDREAWIKKVKADKPEWPQYRIIEEDHKPFMEALGALSIPRFVLLDSNGCFILADAPRPSDKDIDSIIKNSINK